MTTELIFSTLSIALHGAVFAAGVTIACGVSPSASATRYPPEEEPLFESFARGEIDDEAYRRHREILRGRVHSAVR
jgi:uncharacterized membrane protein